MKKNTLYLLGFFIFSALIGFSQNNTFDAQNARDGESVEYCFTHKKMNDLLKNPEYLKMWEKEQAENEKKGKENPVEKGVVYKIPIVFHVLHINGVENISDEQIMDGLAILNRDYRKLNADANNVHPDFAGMPSDVEVEFVLATKAPNGACFNGITRTVSALSYQGADGGLQVDAIVAGNNVYNGQWPGNKYCNVFICGEIGGAAGYTTNPAGWSSNSMQNGIWVLHNYVGSIGTSSVNTSRTLTHETGHWLNLSHVWGGNNNPGNASSCSTDDNVQDTPNCIGVTSCNINSNTCNSDDAYWGSAMRDNVENYMDYSYCSKMFTAGQVTRMRNALNVSNTGRQNLWQAANLSATGATGVVTLCKADFSADKTSICNGDQVQFSDDSYNLATGWTWSFPGGTPSSSTAANPLITYSTPGVYEVSLTATDGTTTDAEVKTQYIRVQPNASSLPFFEGFEGYWDLSNLTNWEVVNVNNNNKFAICNTTSHSGNQCALLNNYADAGPNVDELISAPVDLTTVVGSVTLSFRYAYRKKATGNYEYLKVFITNNCGDVWTQRKTIGGTQLSSIVETASWQPASASEWTTVHMTNVTSDFWVDNFRYKFKFEGNGGNNLYLDDINIYQGAPSDNLVLGLSEAGEINGLNLYPNPAEDEVNVSFTVPNAQTALVQIQDITGKISQSHTINAASGSNLVMLDTKTLAAGVYFVNIKVGDNQKTLQFVIK